MSDLQDDFPEKDDVRVAVELFEHPNFTNLMNFIHTARKVILVPQRLVFNEQAQRFKFSFTLSFLSN